MITRRQMIAERAAGLREKPNTQQHDAYVPRSGNQPPTVKQLVLGVLAAREAAEKSGEDDDDEDDMLVVEDWMSLDDSDWDDIDALANAQDDLELQLWDASPEDTGDAPPPVDGVPPVEDHEASDSTPPAKE